MSYPHYLHSGTSAIAFVPHLIRNDQLAWFVAFYTIGLKELFASGQLESLSQLSIDGVARMLPSSPKH